MSGDEEVSALLAGRRLLVLSGGVGGAKLALGFYQLIKDHRLLVATNIGDDFEHFGLTICPDFDTNLYTLAGLSNQELGWGRADETWTFMAAMAKLGGETWFNLGDGDLALHVERSRRLAAGEPLSTVMADIAARLGITAKLLPISDDPLRTIVATAQGPLSFQQYFVRERCEPVVQGFHFEGAAAAGLNDEIAGAFAQDQIAAVIIAPSNPYVSVDPMLAIPGLRQCLDDFNGAIIAVSPIVGGRAIKGPAAKMMTELGIPASAEAVARHYQGLVNGFVLDQADAPMAGAIADLGMTPLVTPTVMKSLEDRIDLARACLKLAIELSPSLTS